jgi:hypothetical protein
MDREKLMKQDIDGKSRSKGTTRKIETYDRKKY